MFNSNNSEKIFAKGGLTIAQTPASYLLLQSLVLKLTGEIPLLILTVG